MILEESQCHEEDALHGRADRLCFAPDGKRVYGEAHFNLALTYVALKDRKAALDEYNRLKKVDPKLAEDFFQRYMK